MPDTSLLIGFRARQRRLRARFLREYRALWPLLDPARLDQTAASWLALAAALVDRYRAESADDGLVFYRTLRQARTGQLVAPPAPALPDRSAAVATSLRVMGPVNLKQKTLRTGPPARVMRAAETESARAAARHVLDGGRDAVTTSTRSDELAVGFARYASPTACAFCQMLAARGFVYHSRASAGGMERWHDGCACLPVPAFNAHDPLPPHTADYQRAWNDATTGLAGKDAVNAFRRHVEGRAQTSAAPAG